MAIAHSYPVGKMEKLIGKDLELVHFTKDGLIEVSEDGLVARRLHGLVQVDILAPDSMFLPFLPVVADERLKFALCKKCLEDHATSLCQHSDSERALRGVWTTPEIEYAISIGYVVQKIWEANVYEDVAPIFRDFYNRLARMKLESEAVSAEDAQDLEAYVARVNEEMPGLGLSADRLKHNEARRQFSKDCRFENCSLQAGRQCFMKLCFIAATPVWEKWLKVRQRLPFGTSGHTTST